MSTFNALTAFAALILPALAAFVVIIRFGRDKPRPREKRRHAIH